MFGIVSAIVLLANLAYVQGNTGVNTGVQQIPLRVAVSRPPQSISLRGVPFKRQLACSCEGQSCGCCAQINLQQFNFNQPLCISITYNPEELSLTLNVLLNGNSIYETSISGRNPPPFCIPVPQVPFLSICLRLYDVRLVGQNLRACINVEVQVQNNPVLVFAFDCVQIGPAGITVSPKPGSQGETYDAVEDSEESKSDGGKPGIPPRIHPTNDELLPWREGH